MSIVSQRSSSNMRDITEAQIEALKDGDCELLPHLLTHPQAIHKLSLNLRQTLVVALLGVIGDSRSAFTSGVKKESATAMRILTTLVASPASVESSSELKVMLRTLGSEELRKLKLDRHILSSKDDVGPAALEFVKTMAHVIRCEPGDFIQNSAALAKVQQAMQTLQQGASVRPAAEEAPLQRQESSRPLPSNATPTSSAPESATGGPQPAAQAGGGGGGAHRVRALPSKPSSIPHEQNPMYDPNVDGGLMPIHAPNPVLLFAKHFGLGCIPRFPRYSEGVSLTLVVPSRKQPPPAVEGEAPSTVGTSSSLLSPTGDTRPQAGAPTRPQLPTPSSGSSTPPPANAAAAAASNTPPPNPRSPLTSVVQIPPPPVSSPPRAPPSSYPSQLTPPPSNATATATVRGAVAAQSAQPPPANTNANSAPVEVAAPHHKIVVPHQLNPNTASYELLRRYLLSPEGIVVAWGQNKCGELGLGHSATVNTPRIVSTPSKVLHIACGAQYTIMLTKGGQVFSCGAAEWGQLGIGDPSKLTESSEGIPICSTLTAVRGLKPNDLLSDVCAGYAFVVGVTENGEMYLWGNNNHGQCSLGTQLKQESVRVINPMKVGMRATRVISVACGSFFIVILTSTGTVLSWGLVSLLGLGPEDDVLRMIDKKWVAESLSREKRNVVLCPCKVTALDGKGVVQVCAGQWHVIAVTADGAAYSWGVGHQGRLGHGVPNQENKPRRIEGLKDVTVVSASCGSFHSCVLAADGRVFVFGDNANGQCGLVGQPFYLSPTLVPLPVRAIQVSCGRENTTILLSDGDIMVCGSSASTGAGLGVGGRLLAPLRIATNFITLSLHCGINHSFILGVPRALELIPVGTLHAGPPSKITTMMLKDGLISAALGASFTVVVNRNGETFAFGNGDWGQLGMGSTAQLMEKSAVDNMPVILHPVRIPELANVRVAFVAAGYAFVIAITEQQRVYFWGNNNHSQGGLGVDKRSNNRIEQPTEITALADKQVVQVACGSFFVLALTASMEVYSWGIADCCGQGKDPIDVPPSVLTTSTSSEARSVVAVPCKIQSLANVVAVAAGQWHAIALTDKGYVYAWGVGHQGRLGTGDTVTRYVPTKLGFSLSCVAVGCGSFHSWALTAGGDLYMWGDNDSGQCGTDRGDAIVFPQQVASDVRSVSCGRQHSILVSNDGRIRMSGLIVHHEKQFRCKTFDSQPQPPPLVAMSQSGKFALHSFSGPHHTFVLAEKDRPPPQVVREAATELYFTTRRSNFSAPPARVPAQ